MINKNVPMQREPLDAPKSWATWQVVISIVLVALGITALCALRYHDFFFIDDAQNENIGFYREMGRLWLSGHLPLLTTNTMWGGNILVDMVLSPFAPQAIAGSILSQMTSSVRVVADVVAFLSLLLVVGGGYWLGRLLQLRSGLALLLGATVATTPVFLYVYLTSWWNMAQAFAWLLPAVTALLWLRKDAKPLSFVLAVAFGCCLFTSAGTQSQLFYGLMFAVTIIVDWLECRSIRRVAIFFSAGACVLLISAIPLMAEYLLNRQYFSRPNEFNNYNNFLSPSWGYIVNFFNPFFGTYISWFGGYRYLPLSLAYAGMVSLLPFVCKRLDNGVGGTPVEYRILLTGMLLALLMSFSPQQLGPIRWSFRFLPMLVLCFCSIAYYQLEHGVWRDDVRRWFKLLAIVGVMATAIQLFSADGRVFEGRRLVFLGLFAVLFARMAVAILRRKHTSSGHVPLDVLWLVSVLAFGGMLVQTPTLGGAYFSFAGVKSGLLTDGNGVTSGYVLPLALRFPPQNVSDLGTAQMLAIGQKSISGYTPVGHLGFERIFPSRSAHGNFEPQPTLINITNVMDDDRHTPIYKLFDIRRIYVRSDDVTPEIERRFDAVGLTKRTVLPDSKLMIEPQASSQVEGTLTYQSVPGTVVHVRDDGPRSEWFDVHGSDQPRRLIFSRITWPGYHADLNGVPLSVGNWDDVLVSVDLPQKSEGRLHLYYQPVSWHYTRWGILLGVLLTVGTAFLLGRLRHK
ncbi:hypothetical protein [Burkholderia guangdongensis]|uniref:hypothetical protein n=1 Tax=Burkholderia guangdongensis TaxID=1792500 RepID=UPI0015C80E00|nr:hypothetical protein [Burkholderia guangdongensis]